MAFRMIVAAAFGLLAIPASAAGQNQPSTDSSDSSKSAASAPEDDPDARIVCRSRQVSSDPLVPKKRVCKTLEEWRESKRKTRKNLPK